MKHLRKKWVRIVLSLIGGQISSNLLNIFIDVSSTTGFYILYVIIIYLILSLISNNTNFESVSNKVDVPKGINDNKKPLLHNLLWSFALGPYDNIENFGSALYKYNMDINPQFSMDLNEIFLKAEKATIQYIYWGKDDDGEEDQIEEDFQIVSENSNGFSVKEFLFKVHNKVCKHLAEDDAHFFEGLIPHQDESNIPFYFIRQGS